MEDLKKHIHSCTKQCNDCIGIILEYYSGNYENEDLKIQIKKYVRDKNYIKLNEIISSFTPFVKALNCAEYWTTTITDLDNSDISLIQSFESLCESGEKNILNLILPHFKCVHLSIKDCFVKVGRVCDFDYFQYFINACKSRNILNSDAQSAERSPLQGGSEGSDDEYYLIGAMFGVLEKSKNLKIEERKKIISTIFELLLKCDNISSVELLLKCDNILSVLVLEDFLIVSVWNSDLFKFVYSQILSHTHTHANIDWEHIFTFACEDGCDECVAIVEELFLNSSNICMWYVKQFYQCGLNGACRKNKKELIDELIKKGANGKECACCSGESH